MILETLFKTVEQHIDCAEWKSNKYWMGSLIKRHLIDRFEDHTDIYLPIVSGLLDDKYFEEWDPESLSIAAEYAGPTIESSLEFRLARFEVTTEEQVANLLRDYTDYVMAIDSALGELDNPYFGVKQPLSLIVRTFTNPGFWRLSASDKGYKMLAVFEPRFSRVAIQFEEAAVGLLPFFMVSDLIGLTAALTLVAAGRSEEDILFQAYQCTKEWKTPGFDKRYIELMMKVMGGYSK